MVFKPNSVLGLTSFPSFKEGKDIAEVEARSRFSSELPLMGNYLTEELAFDCNSTLAHPSSPVMASKEKITESFFSTRMLHRDFAQ